MLKLIESCLISKSQQAEIDRICQENLTLGLGNSSQPDYDIQIISANNFPTNTIQNLQSELSQTTTFGQKLDEHIEVITKKRDKQLAKNPHKTDPNIQMEIERMKEKVRCSLCRKNDKNAMLVNCKHLFCIDCLRQRYETRQRQCPKCGQKFGLNEFKEIHL